MKSPSSRRSRPLPAIVLSFAVMAGCMQSVITPGVAELEQVQQMDLAGRAAHVPSCRPSVEGCARVYEMTGDACLRLAQEARAGTALPYATCATERFESLRQAGDAGIALRRLEAERLLRENSSGAAVGAANARLATLASQVSAPAAGYYRASAVDWRAAFAGPASCADLRGAEEDASGAAAAAPTGGIDIRAAAAQIARRLAGRASAGGCAP